MPIINHNNPPPAADSGRTSSLPSSEEFYLNHALYDKIDTSSVSWAEVQEMIAAIGTIDSYCPKCGEHSVFTRITNKSESVYNGYVVSFGHAFQTFQCARNNSHNLYFILYLSEKDHSIQKVGQNPSVADLNMHDVKKYATVLSKEYFNELKKAIGLAAHGVGVGSFVYLRRIFENLIEEAKVEAAKDDSFDEQTFKKARMNEKIKLLSGHLPSFLVENHQLYGILSKGVHELSEQECLDAFPAVKVGIELILDEHIVEKQRKTKVEASKKALAALASKN